LKKGYCTDAYSECLTDSDCNEDYGETCNSDHFCEGLNWCSEEGNRNDDDVIH